MMCIIAALSFNVFLFISFIIIYVGHLHYATFEQH